MNNTGSTCAREKSRPSSNFDCSGPLTEVVLLGNLAIHAEEQLLWEGPNMRVTNNETANQFVQRKFGQGWKL
jgi:hypothetical protein